LLRSSDGAIWRPEGEPEPASFGRMPAFARRRRRREAVAADTDPEEAFLPEPPPRAPQLQPRPLRRRYAGQMVESMTLAQTSAYYTARAAIAQQLGHQLAGGVLVAGAFHAVCACGAKLSPGELSAVTTPCSTARDVTAP